MSISEKCLWNDSWKILILERICGIRFIHPETFLFKRNYWEMVFSFLKKVGRGESLFLDSLRSLLSTRHTFALFVEHGNNVFFLVTQSKFLGSNRSETDLPVHTFTATSSVKFWFTGNQIFGEIFSQESGNQVPYPGPLFILTLNLIFDCELSGTLV